jgi:hypothetical protein
VPSAIRGHDFIAGLIGSGDRKSVQPMAARSDEVSYDRLHHCVGSGVWDEAPLEGSLLVEADRLVGGNDAWPIISDTALPKKGAALGWRCAPVCLGAWQKRQLSDAGIARRIGDGGVVFVPARELDE